MSRRRSTLRLLARAGARLLCGWALAALAFTAEAEQVPAVKVPAEAKNPAQAEDQVLAARHKAAGIDCKECHTEGPGSAVATATCQACHAGIEKGEKTKSGKPNPHDAHLPFPDCGQCHHVHKASDCQCDACHGFGYKIP